MYQIPYRNVTKTGRHSFHSLALSCSSRYSPSCTLPTVWSVIVRSGETEATYPRNGLSSLPPYSSIEPVLGSILKDTSLLMNCRNCGTPINSEKRHDAVHCTTCCQKRYNQRPPTESILLKLYLHPPNQVQPHSVQSFLDTVYTVFKPSIMVSRSDSRRENKSETLRPLSITLTLSFCLRYQWQLFPFQTQTKALCHCRS